MNGKRSNKPTEREGQGADRAKLTTQQEDSPENPADATHTTGYTQSTRASSQSEEKPGDIVLAPGTVVGRYLILNKIAAGGMGAVYKAFDPKLDRKVAIKVVSLAHETGEAATRAAVRLTREAKALAQLSHPNVVAVYDVGSFDDDMFIAMALVEGKTLGDWNKEKNRSRAGILDVYLSAGRGLAAAHKAGIIHRDFKPDNVLIGNDGRVQVLDFGIALAVDADKNETLSSDLLSDTLDKTPDPEQTPPPDTPRLTKVGALVGTPSYMSPEQFLGSHIDAKTDQFSFCVALYESLYGQRPFKGKRVSELRANVVAGKLREPNQDSRVPARLRKIITRGLAASPDDRYPTMDALLAQLSDDPGGRRRRRLAFAAIVSVALIGIALATVDDKAAARCQAAGHAVEAVWSSNAQNAIGGAFAKSDVSYAADTAERVRALLEKRANTWAKTRREVCEATWVLGVQSEALLDLRMLCLDRRLNEMRSLVQLFSNKIDRELVGRAVQAISSLDSVDSCAQLAVTGDAYPLPDDPEVRGRIIKLQERMDQLGVLKAAGRYREGLTVGEPLLVKADALEYAPFQAELRLVLGQLWTEVGELERGEKAYASGLVFAARARDPGRQAVLIAKRILSIGYSQDRHADALLLVPHAEAAVIQAGDTWRVRGGLLHVLGVVYRAKGDYAKALTHLQPAFALYKARLDEDSTYLASLENTLGITLYQQRKYDEAIGHLERSRARWEGALGPNHPQVATALNNLAMAYYDVNRSSEAMQAYERALVIFEEVYGPTHPNVAATLTNIGGILQSQRKLEESEAHYRRALEICNTRFGPHHQARGIAAFNLGGILNKRHRHAEALPYHKRAVAIFEASIGVDHAYMGIALIGLGQARAALGERKDALQLLERAHRILEAKESLDLPDARFALAQVLWQTPRTRPRAIDLAQAARSAWATRASAIHDHHDVEEWLRERGADERGEAGDQNSSVP